VFHQRSRSELFGGKHFKPLPLTQRPDSNLLKRKSLAHANLPLYSVPGCNWAANSAIMQDSGYTEEQPKNQNRFGNTRTFCNRAVNLRRNAGVEIEKRKASTIPLRHVKQNRIHAFTLRGCRPSREQVYGSERKSQTHEKRMGPVSWLAAPTPRFRFLGRPPKEEKPHQNAVLTAGSDVWAQLRHSFSCAIDSSSCQASLQRGPRGNNIGPQGSAGRIGGKTQRVVVSFTQQLVTGKPGNAIPM
jgi:hypothetical protein